jgi:hypothetical protein
MVLLKSLELTQDIHNTKESGTAPVGGILGLVLSAENMPQLTRLNLRGNDINVNSRKVIMDLPRVKAGELRIMLSPCLVFVSRFVRFSLQDIKNYLDAGCCVYRHGYEPVYPEEKLYASGLIPVLESQSVRVIGKGEVEFFGLNTTSAVMGDCHCPAGSKGYYELTVVNNKVKLATLGFCSKTWASNLKQLVGKDNETWGMMVDGSDLKFLACGSDVSTESDECMDPNLTLAEGDVIGLGCEIYGNAQARGCQPGWQDWKAGSTSIATRESRPESVPTDISTSGFVPAEDQMLSPKEIYDLEPDLWRSSAVSTNECGGKISVWIYKKSSRTNASVELNPSELKPVFEFNLLPSSLDGLCPVFSCDSGKLRCNLGGKGWGGDDEFCYLPQDYKAMGNFRPPPISPNMAEVFTVLHVPNSLPIASRPSVKVEST